jgi:hypothetical protein
MTARHRGSRVLATCALAQLACVVIAAPAHAADRTQSCRGFITQPGTTLDAPGTWCLGQDLDVSGRSSDLIVIAADDVTLDCNGFRLDGMATGTTPSGRAIHALNRQRATVRNCRITGFTHGIHLNISIGRAGGHRILDNDLADIRDIGILATGDGTVVQRNRITRVGVAPGATGISTRYNVDVVDNTITGVDATYNQARGILTDANQGGSIRGNRVRGVRADADGAFAIRNLDSTRLVVRDNVLVGDLAVGSTDVQCPGLTDRVRDNVIKGFDLSVAGCSDDGNLAKQF